MLNYPNKREFPFKGEYTTGYHQYTGYNQCHDDFTAYLKEVFSEGKIKGILQLRYHKLMFPKVSESDAEIVAGVLAQAIVDYWKNYMKGGL